MKVKQLLEENRRFDAEYQNGLLSNHLSMALFALHKLGASDQRLQEYFSFYSSRLEKLSLPSIEIDEENWQNHLGQQRYYADYIIFFRKQWDQLGREPMLKTYLKILFRGVAAAAFHALIRLAYGIEAGDDEEIIAGLAYFASSYQPLGEGEGKPPLSNSPWRALQYIQADEHFKNTVYKGGNIIERMSSVAADSHFHDIIDWLQLDDTTLHQFAAAAIPIYITTHNFTALHMITATHALRIVIPYLVDQTWALKYFWQAICAAYITIRVPSLLISEKREVPSWDKIFESAIQSPDEHVIKLVYTCYEEANIYNDPLYQSMAAQKAGLKTR